MCRRCMNRGSPDEQHNSGRDEPRNVEENSFTENVQALGGLLGMYIDRMIPEAALALIPNRSAAAWVLACEHDNRGIQ